MRFTQILTAALGANFAMAAVLPRNECGGGAPGGGSGGVTDSSALLNTGNSCPVTHPVASCCNGGSGGILGGILSASSLGCTLGVLQNQCNQQPYCCQKNGGVSLVDISCISLSL